MWLTKVVPSILRVQWVHTGALSVDIDASGSFRGRGSQLRFPYVTVKQRKSTGNRQTRKYVEVWRPYKSNERSTERGGT